MLELMLLQLKEAPKFVKDYENRERSTAAKINLYARATDEDDKNILAMWISNEATWLNDNREKYNKYTTLVAINPSDMESLKALQEEINNV